MGILTNPFFLLSEFCAASLLGNAKVKEEGEVTQRACSKLLRPSFDHRKHNLKRILTD